MKHSGLALLVRTALVSACGTLGAGCGGHGGADPASGAPPPAVVEHERDRSVLHVQRFKRFLLAVATAHIHEDTEALKNPVYPSRRQSSDYEPALGAGCLNVTSGLRSAAGAPASRRATQILSPRSWTGSDTGNVCHPFVIFDEKLAKYRMYYSTTCPTETNESVWDRGVTGIAISSDTVHWTFPEDQPVLFARKFREGEVLESSDLRRTFDSVFALVASVIGRGSTHEMWYAGWSGDIEHVGDGRVRKINYRIGRATSPDGLAWTKQPGDAGGGAVLGLGAAGEPDARGAADPFVLKQGGVYRMWYAGYDGDVWRICAASSTDGQGWTKQGIALGPGGESDELGLRYPVVVLRSGRYELWYQARSRSVPEFHVRRATSPDGISWKELPAEVALHPDPPVEDDEEIHVGSLRRRPNGTVQVFFAKQNTRWRRAPFGRVPRKSFSVYSETVSP